MPAAGFVARTAGASARPFPSFPTSHVNDAVSPASRTPSPSVSVIVARERRSEAAVIGTSTSNVSARAASRATSRRRAMPGAFGMASAWARSVSGSVSWVAGRERSDDRGPLVHGDRPAHDLHLEGERSAARRLPRVLHHPREAERLPPRRSSRLRLRRTRPTARGRSRRNARGRPPSRPASRGAPRVGARDRERVFPRRRGTEGQLTGPAALVRAGNVVPPRPSTATDERRFGRRAPERHRQRDAAGRGAGSRPGGSR